MRFVTSNLVVYLKNINNKKLSKMEKITKEDFEAYVDVQMSGVTNMFDVRTVSDLSGLEKEQIMTIMTNYGELQDKYDVK